MSVPSAAEVEHADWPSLKQMAQALGLNPKGRSGLVRTRVLDHVRRRAQPEAWRASPVHAAALLTRLGFPEAAARIWESAVRLDAPGPWVGLGRAHLLAGELTEAAKAFDRAAAMGDATAHLARAEALAAEGNYEGAIRACDAYLDARPDDLRGVALKARFLARGGWSEEAAGFLRRLFEAHANVTELWRGLGEVLLRSGRHEAAAEAYHEVVRADPSDATGWTNRGAALLLAGLPKESIGDLREALELDPAMAEALNNLGVAYLQTGQSKSAAVNLERAAKHLEIPTVLTNLARAYESGRQTARAADALARARRLRAPGPSGPVKAVAPGVAVRVRRRVPARKTPAMKSERRPRRRPATKARRKPVSRRARGKRPATKARKARKVPNRKPRRTARKPRARTSRVRPRRKAARKPKPRIPSRRR